MDKCYTVEWNSRGGDPELVEVFKSFDAALKHCVECMEESKTGEEEYNPDRIYHIVVETVEAATWVELHVCDADEEDQQTTNIEWFKIKTWEFADDAPAGTVPVRWADGTKGYIDAAILKEKEDE